MRASVPVARACVFTSATDEGRTEEKAEEGGMVDNSGSSKAQMVSGQSGSGPGLARVRRGSAPARLHSSGSVS